MFCVMKLKLIKHWEIDIIVMPILRMEKLKLRGSQLEVAVPGASSSSSDPKVKALSCLPHGGHVQVCFITKASALSKCSLGLLDPNQHALREHKPCFAGVYYFKWTLMGQGKAYMDKCTNSSNRTKNIGLNEETNE